MPKNRYYYYDQEQCAFVEHRATRAQRVKKAAGVAVVALMLAGVYVWGFDRMIETPQELALKAENEALQEQLALVGERMAAFSKELEKLSETDQRLYRSLLEAEPISDDVRQVGVGGADAYEEYSRFSASTSSLLRQTARQIDQLERQIGLQNASYRELTRLAEEHAARMTEMPAILPADGPVVSGFGMRFHPILRVRRMHYGVDVLVPRGTPVVATGDGVIEEAGKGSGYGNYVKVKHPTLGYSTLYAHLSRIPGHIRRGRKVKRGEVIGYSGNTGLSNAPHLHYEVHDADGRALNPIFFFAPGLTPTEYQRLLEAAEQSTTSLD
ncbi:M23 family metallopeptidase [Rhodocaloribacter litoris]|uniref:M23 family metallopeptidase n=1 Tax=Rhodocaloribacter litoris TaxID=2558931 RepID=UPI0014238251|nr:M23 family metallopeptidase [Rhodocaloribacter litoris]QXD13974.1 M23 family metallopeptidase [Rhodocaloribacter litoris]